MILDPAFPGNPESRRGNLFDIFSTDPWSLILLFQETSNNPINPLEDNLLDRRLKGRVRKGASSFSSLLPLPRINPFDSLLFLLILKGLPRILR